MAIKKLKKSEIERTTQVVIPPHVDNFLKLLALWTVEAYQIEKQPKNGHGPLPAKGV